jgi:phytoene/squalene synthetase
MPIQVDTAKFSEDGHRSARLARSITWSGSKHSYLIARLFVDGHLKDDCFRAYGYFRWADDVVDDPARSLDERLSFIRRQQDLVRCLYQRQITEILIPEEQIIADLIEHDRGENSSLRSFILGFLDILDFDANRKGTPIGQQQLTWYSHHLGRTVTDGIQYFVGNDRQYPQSDHRHLAATGAHITHMLRDMAEDIPNGFINIPIEYLETEGISVENMESAAFRAWIRRQVDLAREYFRQGRRYIDGLDVLRCKLVAYWYCARFECVLDAIERDDYILRSEYSERRNPSTLLKLIRDSLRVTFDHIARRPSKSSQPMTKSQEQKT